MPRSTNGDSTTNSLLPMHERASIEEDEEEEMMHCNHFHFGANGGSNNNDVLREAATAATVCPISHVAGKFSISDDDDEEFKESNVIVIGIPAADTTTNTATDCDTMENALPLSLSQNNNSRKPPLGSSTMSAKKKKARNEDEGTEGLVPRIPSQTTALQRKEDTRP